VAWLGRQDLDRAEQHWRAALLGLAGPTPLLLPAPADAQAEQEPCRARLPEAGSEALQAFARAHGLTLSTLVQGAWALLLGARSGSDDVVFGVTVSGRPPELPGVERMLGLFVNTLPARVRIEAGRPLTAWLRELQAEQAETHEFEYAPLALVQSWSGAQREWPLFESLVVFENYPVESSLGERAPLEVALVDVRVHQRTHYGLTLIAAPGRELSLSLGFDPARFARAGVEGWLSALVALLGGMAAQPEGSLGELQALVRGSEPVADVLPAPAPVRRARELPERPGVSLGATERAIADAWSEVLGLHHIGRGDAFFDLGGNSLQLIRVRGQLAAALGVTVPMRALFDHPTVASLAAFLHADPAERSDAPGAATSRTDGRVRLGQRLKRASAAAGDRRAE
jgi:non-ribosomal peptide synthetase component F